MKSYAIAFILGVTVLHSNSIFQADYKHYPQQPPVTCPSGKAQCS